MHLYTLCLVMHLICTTAKFYVICKVFRRAVSPLILDLETRTLNGYLICLLIFKLGHSIWELGCEFVLVFFWKQKLRCDVALTGSMLRLTILAISNF